MKNLGWLVLLVCAGTFSARAEVVLFKNGDQLTGDWQRVVDGRMTFRAEALGDVTVAVSKVKSFTSQRMAVVLVKTGEAYSGDLSLLDSGDWELRGKDGGTRRLAPATVVAIYPQALYLPKPHDEYDMPWENWAGRGNVGYSLVRGDQDAGSLSVGFSATRRQPNLPGYVERFRTNYSLNLLFANTQTASGIRISTNNITSALRQDFLFSPSNFVFILAQLDHSGTQSLDLRQTYGGGLGRDVFRRRRAVVQFLGGATFVQEDFQAAVKRRNSEGLLGEKLTWSLTDRVGLDHYLNLYPNLTDGGEFRVDTTSTLSTRLSSRLSFNTTFTARHQSRPLPGRQQNELVLTTGLGLSF